jgi:hypothetical protein
LFRATRSSRATRLSVTRFHQSTSARSRRKVRILGRREGHDREADEFPSHQPAFDVTQGGSKLGLGALTRDADTSHHEIATATDDLGYMKVMHAT